MKYKVSELDGMLLDAAVAKAEGREADAVVFCGLRLISFAPSTDWAQGGPIIERDGIGLDAEARIPGYSWTAVVHGVDGETHAYADSALIAAMRAYVAAKFGKEVELP